MEKLEVLSAQFAAARQTYLDTVEPALKEAFADLFTQFPELEAIRWTQYSPHFNDGDACTFGVNEFQVSFGEPEESDDVESESEIEESDDDDDDDEDDGDDEYYEGDFVDIYLLDEKYEPIERLSNWAGYNPDIFESMFDNHVEVTVTRAGFSVNEHYHE